MPIKKVSFIQHLRKWFLIILTYIQVMGLYFPTTDIFVIITVVVLSLIFIHDRQKIDKSFIYIIIFFLFINLFTLLFFEPFSFYTFLGYILRLTVSYLLIKLYPPDILENIVKFITIMAIVSIPLYIAQQIVPGFFKSIFHYFEWANTDERISVEKYGYLIHTIDFNILIRNNGFAWEPGGFAYLLGMALIYNTIINGFKLNKRNLLFILVGITTFSTTFFVFIAVYLIWFLLNARKENLGIIIIVIVVIFLFLPFIYNLPFMGDKIQTLISKNDKITSYNTVSYVGVGRFANFYIEMRDFLRFPFGLGVNVNGYTQNSYGTLVSGPCGLVHIISRWGISGIILLSALFYKLSISLKRINYFYGSIFIGAMITIFLFSNPIERDPTFITILLYPIYYKYK